MSAQMAAPTAAVRSSSTGSTLRRIEILIGLLATHLLLGIVSLFGMGALVIGKYGLFGPPEPPVVDDAAGVAVIAWFVALGFATWQWGTNRRYAFLTPCAWAVLAWMLMIVVVAATPAPAPDPAECWGWC
jgi:hypothetical protein